MYEDESVIAAGIEDELRVHPAADLFPLMDGQAFEELVADIRDHGLREPVVLDGDGRIVDGRNRYRACRAAGVPVRTVSWDEQGSPIDYVVSKNLHRRHLRQNQRAIVAARIANFAHGGDRTKWPIGHLVPQQKAAALMSVGKRTVERACKVLDGTPELVAAVESGDVSVSQGASLAALPPAEQVKAITAQRAPRAAPKKGKKPKLSPGEDSPAMASMKTAWLAFMETYRAGTPTERQRVIRWTKEWQKWPRGLDAIDIDRFDESQASGPTPIAVAASRA
jgi:hypothetical protein